MTVQTVATERALLLDAKNVIKLIKGRLINEGILQVELADITETTVQ